jgi:beta-glucosidase
VLETGGPVAMPWLEPVSAAIEAWYPGIRGAEAIARVLFGDVNPSGKLPVSFAKSEADLPHPQIAGSELAPKVTNGRAEWPPFEAIYTEGLRVGYKWFDAEDKQPLFAFGHGLSYTSFEYSGLKATNREVVFTVKNTGKRNGAEIAQVYASLPPTANEPPRRLVAWDKISLAPGESKTVTCKLDPKFLSIFNVDKNDWELLPGEYRIFVGGSSRQTTLSETLREP